MKKVFFLPSIFLLFSFTTCFDVAISRTESYVRQSNGYGVRISDSKYIEILNYEYALCDLASSREAIYVSSDVIDSEPLRIIK